MIRTVALITGVIVVALACVGGGADAAASLGGAGRLVRPVAGARVSQPFGCTWFAQEPVDRACPGGHFHSGIDLAAPPGTPVRACGAGTVTVIHSAWGYGLHVVIDHGGGISSLYGHLSEVDVAGGDYVTAGEVIGAVGSTGNSTGPHLHFEIRRSGVPEDPASDIPLP